MDLEDLKFTHIVIAIVCNREGTILAVLYRNILGTILPPYHNIIGYVISKYLQIHYNIRSNYKYNESCSLCNWWQ